LDPRRLHGKLGSDVKIEYGKRTGYVESDKEDWESEWRGVSTRQGGHVDKGRSLEIKENSGLRVVSST